MNTYEKLWKVLLNSVINDGSVAVKDDAKIYEKLGNHIFVVNPYWQSGYAGIVNKDTFAQAIKNGSFDIEDYPLKGEALHDYVTSLMDSDKIVLESDDSFIYTYPERLINYFPHDFEYPSVNQLEVLHNRLLEHKGSNRAVAVTLIPQWDMEREDIPCLQVVQAIIRGDELVLSVFFRSNDLYGAWISNMMFLTYLGLWLVDNLQQAYPLLMFKGIDYHSSSLHIYETDINNARKVVKI